MSGGTADSPGHFAAGQSLQYSSGGGLSPECQIVLTERLFREVLWNSDTAPPGGFLRDILRHSEKVVVVLHRPEPTAQPRSFCGRSEPAAQA